METFYIYIYKHPDTLIPFYVGKGKGDRAYYHLKCCPSDTNKHKVNTIKKILNAGKEPVIEFYRTNLTEQEAFDLEIRLIKSIGRKDLKTGPLCNKTDGGDGGSGYKPTKEVLDKIKRNYTREWREKASKRCSGENNGFYGRTLTDEHKQKLAEGRKMWSITDEQRKKLSEAKKGRKPSKQARDNMSIKFDISGPNGECFNHITINDLLEKYPEFPFNTIYKSYKLNRPVTRGPAKGWFAIISG